MTHPSRHRLRWLTIALISVVFVSGCSLLGRSEDPRVSETGGNVQRGQELARTNGCLACHSVSGQPGVAQAYGPSLDGFADQRLIAGTIANNPENLVLFLMSPQSQNPDSAMPLVGLTLEEAEDIAAWLYTLDD